jgi:hypothetical protein
MSRTFFFAALAGLTLSTPIAADTLGCTVLLCTSPGAPPWLFIPRVRSAGHDGLLDGRPRDGLATMSGGRRQSVVDRKSGSPRGGLGDEVMIC